MMKVFIDTNILIDFLAAREPFAEEAMALFQLADNDEIELIVSDLTIINTIYVLRRMHYGLSEIYDSLDNIRPLLTITSMGATVVDRCLQHRSDDFEDEMQYFSAIDANADYIITRNKKDFDFGDSAVMTPQEFFKEQNIEFE
jgi:predicted nucleic acid-binding protein